MSSLRNELPLWRSVSGKLDELYMTEKLRKDVQTCPFCGKSSIRMLETIDGPDIYSRIGFFTCRACEENWSGLIDR